MRSAWGVFGILLAGAVSAAAFGSTPLAEWADTHQDWPAGEQMAAALHGWDDLMAPLGQPRRWLHATFRQVVAAPF